MPAKKLLSLLALLSAALLTPTVGRTAPNAERQKPLAQLQLAQNNEYSQNSAYPDSADKPALTERNLSAGKSQSTSQNKVQDKLPSGNPTKAGKPAPSARRSPKSGWGDFEVIEEQESGSVTRQILLWIPNRFLDLVDAFKFDVGLGPAVGGVVRLTKYGQFGYRKFHDSSLRIGNIGRDWPGFVERSNEEGFGPWFQQSTQREICTGELGGGVDLVLVSLHLGLCTEQLFDFGAGVIFFDPMDDDLK